MSTPYPKPRPKSNPFGSSIKLRSFSAGSGFRFGCQSQEGDDEMFGDGNCFNYRFRIHDSRIGRFLAVDPLSNQYPGNSQYSFSQNRLIDGVDFEGLEYINAILATDKFYSELGFTFADELEKQAFVASNTIMHNGVNLINLGFHVYQDGQGGYSKTPSSGCAEKITCWIYTPIQLFDKTKHHAFGWNDPLLKGKSKSNNETPANAQCADLAEAQAKNMGASLKNGAVSKSAMIISYNAVFNKLMANDEAIDYLNRQLEKGKPVVVGVTDGPGNNDKIGTDHFITITGRKEEDGINYFLFMENAVNYNSKSKIMDFKNNKLEVSVKGIKGKVVHYGGHYQVTRVQINKS